MGRWVVSIGSSPVCCCPVSCAALLSAAAALLFLYKSRVQFSIPRWSRRFCSVFAVVVVIIVVVVVIVVVGSAAGLDPPGVRPLCGAISAGRRQRHPDGSNGLDIALVQVIVVVVVQVQHEVVYDGGVVRRLERLLTVRRRLVVVEEVVIVIVVWHGLDRANEPALRARAVRGSQLEGEGKRAGGALHGRGEESERLGQRPI